jgi:type II secretory pathway predicted ATPase ExeA
MFLEHFGLQANPFGVTSDARYLYFGQDHRDALSALYLSIVDGRGLSALVAHAGMGKTTLLRYLAARLHGKAATAFVSHPYSNSRDLMRDVLRRLGLEAEDTEFHQMSRLQTYLRNLMQRKTKVVLLFDECQALSFEALEHIRLLSNLRSSNMNLIEIVVAGQSEFEEMLEQPQHEALRQRIGTLARIRRFREDDVRCYIERRLLVSGRREPLFEADAIVAATRWTRGIPRNINHLCHKAMQLAWADGDRCIGAQVIHEAARNLEWRERDDEDADSPDETSRNENALPAKGIKLAAVESPSEHGPAGAGGARPRMQYGSGD